MQVGPGIRLALHIAGEEFEVVAPVFFGPVHGLVGAAQQLFVAAAVVGEHRDADTRRNHTLLALDQIEWQGQLLKHMVRNLLHIFGRF